MMLKGNTESLRYLLEAPSVSAKIVRPSTACNPGAIQPRNLKLLKLVPGQGALNRNTIECRMTHKYGAAQTAAQLFAYFRQGGTPDNVVFVNSMNSDVRRIEPILRIDEGFPLVLDFAIPNVDNANLAYARAVRIGGLDVNTLARPQSQGWIPKGHCGGQRP